MLLPLQGVWGVWVPFTQGAALGYVLLPLRGVPLVSFDTLAEGTFLARLVHFLLWQAAKPSGDKCTP